MVYLDHAATTDLRPEAREAWLDAARLTGNPASLHRNGRQARRLVEESRERIASVLDVAPSTIVFTSGGTESDNIAVAGAVAAQSATGSRRTAIVLPRTEHKAILEPAQALGQNRILWLECGSDGRVDVDDLKAVLAERADDIALVTLMAVNNETGVVQQVAQAGRLCDEFGVAFHVDAVQALGVLPLDLAAIGSAAFSAHKVGGPMGVGLLYVRPGTAIAPLSRGGGHESGLRAGTVNVPGIAAAAIAAELAVRDRDRHARHLARLRALLLHGLGDPAELGFFVNSPADGVPGIVNLAFPGCESDALMMLLDAAGVAVSTGSACTVGIPRPSHVLLAMGRSPVEARSALRISFGHTSTEGDVAALLAALPEAVARARRAGMLTQEPA